MSVPDFARNITDPLTPCISHGPIHRAQYYGKASGPSSHTVNTASVDTAKADVAKTDASKSAGNGDSGDSFFDDLLDIINPLQHIPVVSTIYRAITGDKIGDVERIAGGALYGGLLGLGGAVADVAFEHITGRDFGDTVLALVTGDDDTPQTAVASATPQSDTAKGADTTKPAATAQQPAQVANTQKPANPIPAQAIVPNIDTAALLSAMKRNGVDPDLGMRALAAYQKTLVTAPVPDKTKTGP